MPRSQNATFCADEPETIGDRIRGASIVEEIRTALLSRGWTPGAVDDWRDAGFIFSVCRDRTSLDVRLTQYYGDDRRWILQITATREPGMLGRLLGTLPSASPEEIYALAADVQAIFRERAYTDTRWCWDDFAEGDYCSYAPSQPQATRD